MKLTLEIIAFAIGTPLAMYVGLGRLQAKLYPHSVPSKFYHEDNGSE